ncbi:MAG: DEAD/DEAH box helicase family protein [Myxococcota bacterium]
MKLHFDSNLPHQRAAIDAVVQAVEAQGPRTRGGLQTSPAGPVFANPGGLPPRLAVEMETGTGKTYVFLRTALTLASRFGVRSFVIVVPSVAIREGVLATLRSTKEHFAALFPDVPYRFFAYRRERLLRLRQFVRASTVEFAVLTIDAFTKDTNVLRRPCDAFAGRSALEALAATGPVVIADEPHHYQTALRKGALDALRPGMVLAYGATLGAEPGRVVHRLTPAQAHAQGLVKSIVVHGRDVGGDAGYASQIRDTIDAHLRRQAQLHARGIKVLSLFFLDRVARYADEADGLARALFDQHFDDLKGAYPHFASRRAASVRAAYFATRSGAAADSKTGRSAADVAAYDLILRDKPRLLSFDEPVSFVFSHSALREGWDNPNVFQICTLARSDAPVRQRQEIGRGVRLCVDQAGRRVQARSVNVLDVFANESYEAFVAGLQSADASRPEQERAPTPRPCTRPPNAAEPPSVVVPSDDVLVRRCAAALAAFEPAPCDAPPPFLEVAVRALARRGLPLRRSTIADIVRHSTSALASDPVRGAEALADAVQRAVTAS